MFAEHAFAPDWSPDGKSLAYYAEPKGTSFRSAIVVRSIDGGEADPLSVNKKNLYSFETNLDWLACRG